MGAYEDFLARKAMVDPMTGIVDDVTLPDVMFPFQADIARWALKRGRAAIFAGTGLGKSLMELAWGKAVAEHTALPVMHLAPLAVAPQMVREADKFGIPCQQVATQADVRPGINITNYQKLDHFDLSAFGGVILDESSILKSTDGHYRTKLIEECQQVPFRLAATATPAPNDFMELGNHAEFLGVMSYTDMLATFFTHDGGDTSKWRLKGHAENEFWKWMASWSVMIRKPSDLGYEDTGYDLPTLTQVQHTVKIDRPLEDGALFGSMAATMSERIVARRDSVAERVAMAHAIVLAEDAAKLAECLGNQNTPQLDALNINPTQPSEKDGKNKSGAARKTKPTCGYTSKDVLKSSENLKSKETVGCDLNTGSDLQNTTQCSSSRAENAQSADTSPKEHGGVASQSIIATQQEKSEDFSATDAIMDLGTSKTMNHGFNRPWLIWCNLNSEQDALKRLFGDACFSVNGSMDEDEKERQILGWINAERPIMLSKPSIMGFGLNFQHCSDTVFVGLNDSFEQVYQAIRRFWRFGQTMPVTVHMIAAETEGSVVANLRRKEADADRMAAAMVLHMADLSTRAIRGQVRDTPNYNPSIEITLPAWMNGERA